MTYKTEWPPTHKIRATVEWQIYEPDSPQNIALMLRGRLTQTMAEFFADYDLDFDYADIAVEVEGLGRPSVGTVQHGTVRTGGRAWQLVG